MKILKKISLVLLVLCVGMQFYRPDKNRAQGAHMTQFLTETNPPEMVKTWLEQRGYNCHSNNSQYPWYSNVAPVSYWLADDISVGKEHLNFSEWHTYGLKKKDHKFEELIEEVSEGKIPIKVYTFKHETSRLTEIQRKAVIDWAKQTRPLFQLNLRLE